MAFGGILGFQYGIVQAPLGPDISSPELVAAVANAGGLGLLRAPDWVSFSILFLLSAFRCTAKWKKCSLNVTCCGEASSDLTKIEQKRNFCS